MILGERMKAGAYYYPGLLEEKLRSVKHHSAEEIFVAITADLLSFSTPCDDISLVVIKKK